MNNLTKVLEIMETLRDKDKGCPWTNAQTMQTIVPHTIEESYELADSIARGVTAEIQGELADLLYQIIFYCQISKEQGNFEFENIVDTLKHKLVDRHPHVFDGKKIEDINQLNVNWEQQKFKERSAKVKSNGLLADVPKNLPSLTRAQKIQKRAASVGFEWPSLKQVFAKLKEEIVEFEDEIDNNEKQKAIDELGDIMFTCVNLARFLDSDSEMVLRQATNKFEERFAKVEQMVAMSKKPWHEFSIDELEDFWRDAKR